MNEKLIEHIRRIYDICKELPVQESYDPVNPEVAKEHDAAVYNVFNICEAALRESGQEV